MIEVDFYEVVSKKLSIIQKNENLFNMIATSAEAEIPILHEKHINSH